MLSVGFEPAIPACKLTQTPALEQLEMETQNGDPILKFGNRREISVCIGMCMYVIECYTAQTVRCVAIGSVFDVILCFIYIYIYTRTHITTHTHMQICVT